MIVPEPDEDNEYNGMASKKDNEDYARGYNTVYPMYSGSSSDFDFDEDKIEVPKEKPVESAAKKFIDFFQGNSEEEEKEDKNNGYKGPWSYTSSPSGYSRDLAQFYKGKTAEEMEILGHYVDVIKIPSNAVLGFDGNWGWSYRAVKDGGKGLYDVNKNDYRDMKCQ